MDILSNLLGCKVGTLPLSYLGLPLCLSKPETKDFVPMLKRIENILIGYATLLSSGDKLTLIKSVFASMPIFFMCSLRTPKTVINQINYYLGQCLWRKYGPTQTGSALISWEEVCKP